VHAISPEILLQLPLWSGICEVPAGKPLGAGIWREPCFGAIASVETGTESPGSQAPIGKPPVKPPLSVRFLPLAFVSDVRPEGGPGVRFRAGPVLHPGHHGSFTWQAAPFFAM
jgi:hypothetical protein